jgi:hypothetical protein
MAHSAFIYKTVYISRQGIWNVHISYPDERTDQIFQNEGKVGLRLHMVR